LAVGTNVDILQKRPIILRSLLIVATPWCTEMPYYCTREMLYLAVEEYVVWSNLAIQGGVESYDALSLLVIFRERALYMVALLRKMTCNLRHPMPLRHPVHKDVVEERCCVWQ